MNIAELFINLGVKGSEKTLGGVLGVQKGLKDTASTSLEAKAAIVGAMYALERLFSTSNKAGTDLTNFNATVGTSAQTLQQYQYAARQVGVSNEEVTGSFKTLQQQMTKTLMGEGAPKGLARVSQLLGDFSAKDIEEFSRKPELLFQKLQEYANKERSLPLRNEVLKSFGLGDGVIASMARNAYRPDVMQKAPTYSDKEIGALDRANVAWSNLGTKIEMAIGHFNAAHGGELVKDFSMITDKVIKLGDAFMHLAEKADLFKGIGKVFEGWGYIFKGLEATIENITKIVAIVKELGIGGTAEAVAGEVVGDDKAKGAGQAVEGALSTFTSFIAKEYGKYVLGVAAPEEKKDPNNPSGSLFGRIVVPDIDGTKPGAPDKPIVVQGKPGAPAAVNVQVKPPAPGAAPPVRSSGFDDRNIVDQYKEFFGGKKGASTPTVMAVPPTMGVKPMASAPTAVSKPTSMAVPGAPAPERRLKLVAPPSSVPPAKSIATPPPSLPARQAAAAPAGGKSATAPGVVNFEQNLNFGSAAADPARTAAASRNGVREAYREIAAQGEGG